MAKYSLVLRQGCFQFWDYVSPRPGMCLVCIHRMSLENSQRDTELLDRVDLDTSFLGPK